MGSYRMRRRITTFPRLLGFGVLLALGVANASDGAAGAASLEPFDQFVERITADWVRADPAGATTAQYFAGEEQYVLDRELNAKDTYTFGGVGIPLRGVERAQFVARARRTLSGLKRYSSRDLTSTQRITAATLRWQVQNALNLASAADYRYVFDQLRGLHVGLVNFLSQIHPIRTPRDIDSYIARLAQVSAVLDVGITEAKRRAAKGIIPPKFILHASLEQIDRFLNSAPADNVLVTSLSERAKAVEGLADDQRATALASAETIVRDQILPAFQRVHALLTDQLSLATEDAGYWHLPNGVRVYEIMLRSNTSTHMTPDQVYSLGVLESARIEHEMDSLLRQLGFAEGSVLARYEALADSVQPAADPDPRPTLLAEYSRILRDAEKRSEVLFGLRPRAAVQVLREPPLTEKSLTTAHYVEPAPDGTRPGVVSVPLPGPTFDVLAMRTVIYHEGVPGHHFQIALQQETTGAPSFRRKPRVFGLLSAFAEGWGLYAEHLAAESGWYEDDPKGHLGQLYWELLRAHRLVADVGLHVKHWTRQQAIDYGIPPTEVDRYVVWPGQACAYMVGELELLRLRAKAQQALGPRFSLQEFHRWVLQTGTVPLSVLAEVIDDNIAASMKTMAPTR